MISEAVERAIDAYRDAMREVGGRYGTLNDQLNQCVAARAALVQAIEEAIGAAAQWRPIDSAPKDGSGVLLSRRIGPPIIAGWFKGDWFTIEDPAHPIKRGPVTHWMPLRAAPAAAEDKPT